MCESCYSYAWTLPRGSYVLRLTRKDKDIEIVSTRDIEQMRRLLGALPEMVIGEEGLGMLVDMEHWEKSVYLFVDDNCLFLSCWAKFPVEKEDSEETEGNENQEDGE